MHFLLIGKKKEKKKKKKEEKKKKKKKKETNVQKQTCSACLESPMFLFNHYHIKILCSKKLHV